MEDEHVTLRRGREMQVCWLGRSEEGATSKASGQPLDAEKFKETDFPWKMSRKECSSTDTMNGAQ